MDLSVIPDITMRGHVAVLAPTVTVGAMAGIVRQVAASPAEWWHLVRFDGRPVPLAADCELWLSAWPPGHRATPQARVLAVLAGELRERIITPEGVTGRAVRANRVQVYGSPRPRELVNPGPGYAITLHATAG